MYRKLIVSIAASAALLAATPAFGQNFQQTNKPAPPVQKQVNTGLGLGVQFGGTWTSVHTENNFGDISFDQGAGILAGVWFGGNRDGRAGLQGEVNYTTKVVKFNDGVNNIESKTKYIQIPVLLRINAGARERDKPCFYFVVGPNFDIKVGEDSAFTELFSDPDNVYEGVEIGLMAGAGFEVMRFGVTVRYSWGLKNVLGTDAAEEAGFGNTKFNTLQINGTFRIN